MTIENLKEDIHDYQSVPQSHVMNFAGIHQDQNDHKAVFRLIFSLTAGTGLSIYVK